MNAMQPTPPEADYLTETQVRALLQDLAPHRVAKDERGMSHLEGWDVRAHLIRVFGFGRWSSDLRELHLLYEEPREVGKGKLPGYRVAYRATVRLAIYSSGGRLLASYTEAAVGESTMGAASRGDCHDMAIKTAETQALKRCAVNLGTRFGLSLYNNGSLKDVVGGRGGIVLVEGAKPVPDDDGTRVVTTAGDYSQRTGKDVEE